MFVLKPFCPLIAIGRGEFTTSAPDYSDVSVAEFVMMLFVMIAIVGVIVYIVSLTGKRRN